MSLLAEPTNRPISDDPDDFDPGRAARHVEALGSPRRVGTVRERRAARYILRQFAAEGLERVREPFPIALGLAEVGRALTFAGSAGLVLGGAALSASHPMVAAVAWLLASRMIHTPWRIGPTSRRASSSRSSSQNILARAWSGLSAPAVRVVFMAHYDTKSQLLPTGLRVGLVIASTALCGGLAGLALLAAAGAPQILGAIRPDWLAAVVAVLLAILGANRSGDRSPGVIDNGSGVGTLLELARTWRPEPGADVEAIWIATGSEELGLEGARAVLERHAHWWDEVPTLLINLESVGAGDRVYLAGEPGALALAEAIADRLEVPRARLRILGAGMDHEPFSARGLPALSIMGDVVRTSFAFHTRRDDLDLLERSALGRAGRLAGAIAHAWADRHRPIDRDPAVESAEPEALALAGERP